MSYIILRGRWCHIIVLNVHAPTEDETDYVKGSFYEELERVIDKFPKCRMKILLGDFNAKVGREDFLNRQLGMKVYTKLVMIMENDSTTLSYNNMF
jgi:exonuclease III